MSKKISKEEMKKLAWVTVPKCKIIDCDQEVYFEPEPGAPLQTYLEPAKRQYFEADGSPAQGPTLTATNGYPLVPHVLGLCYYHLKKDLGLFNREYPLKGMKRNPLT